MCLYGNKPSVLFCSVLFCSKLSVAEIIFSSVAVVLIIQTEEKGDGTPE